MSMYLGCSELFEAKVDLPLSLSDVYHNIHLNCSFCTLVLYIRTDSLPVVAPTVEDWSVSERTQVREGVSQTTHTEGTAHTACNS